MSMENVAKKAKLDGEFKHCHWDDTRPRDRGLGKNIIRVSGRTLCVKDIAESMWFYTDLLKFKVDPTFPQNDQTVTFNCKNINITLIKGDPVSFAAKNLIVSHMAMDLPNLKPEEKKEADNRTEREKAEYDLAHAQEEIEKMEDGEKKGDGDKPKEKKPSDDEHDVIKQAFKYLKFKKIPFEINVSVSTGGGESFAKSGNFDHTVGQAFVRDPSGYYFEFCNCFKIDSFVLGKKEKDYLHTDEYLKNYRELFANHTGSGYKINWEKVDQWKHFMIYFMGYKATQAKKRVAQRKANPEKWYADELAKAPPAKWYRKLISPMPSEDECPTEVPEEVKEKILHNMMKRSLIYQNIVQSFDPDSHDREKNLEDKTHHVGLRKNLTEILEQANYYPPKAIAIMHHKIAGGDVKKMAQPPPFFIGDTNSDHQYTPEQLADAAEEKGVHKFAPEMTAGEESMWKKFLKATEKDKILTEPHFEITGFNHIGIIVKDVGNTADFLSDVIGLQAVMRPNFDTHGAWFTGGNLEVHLIEGNPLAPDRSVPASRANAISLLVGDLALAKEVLKKKCAEWTPEPLPYEEDESACYTRSPDGYVFKIHA